MSNPFEGDDSDSAQQILEGFLCPICREDLKSLEFLTTHFDREHAETQDALKSIFKDIFVKTKNKIRQNFDDTSDVSRGLDKNGTPNKNNSNQPSSSNATTAMNVYNFMDRQEVGVHRDHMEYFRSIRNPRLERYASETNKLIIRLNKLLRDMPTDPSLRKQHEQNIVVWLDGSSVKLCPNCAKNFHLARRQHHCRLCGSIMCHDCSKFLSIDIASKLASPIFNTENTDNSNKVSHTQLKSLRLCNHCLWLLEVREDMHESRTCSPPVAQIYAEIQKIKKDVLPDIDMYIKIVTNLYEGESIFTIADASALRGKIGQMAESIDIRSKRILALEYQEGSREESLKKAIRLSCIQLIRDKMLSLPRLPTEEEIHKIQEMKRIETEQRIEAEKQRAMEAYKRYELGGLNTSATRNHTDQNDFRSLDNWSGDQINTSIGTLPTDDPLLEQINIIKGYIKQARHDMNFEVVETLEINLRELQAEYQERLRFWPCETKHSEENDTNADTTQNAL